MAKIFISYTRSYEEPVKILSDDIEAMGHTVWFDKKLCGGQQWWDEIVGAIQSCEIFVVYISPDTLSSIACKLEWGYARALGIPILPVIGEGGVSPNLLPPELSIIQFIDYRNRDNSTLLSLVKALNGIKTPSSLPDPLPEPPEIPLSHLSKLAQRIETLSNLSLEEQSSLIIELKAGIRDISLRNDIITLLKRFEKRKDLYVSISSEIYELIDKYNFTKQTDKKSNRFVIYEDPIYTFKIDRTFILLIISAFLCGLSTLPLENLPIHIDLFYYQIFIAFYIGYKYSYSLAKFSGFIIFLPNFLLHIYCMHLAPISFWMESIGGPISDKVNITYFNGKYRFNEVLGGATLGIYYFIYSAISIVVSRGKLKIHEMAKDIEYLSKNKIKRSNNTIVYSVFLVPILQNSINIGFITITGCYILHSLLIMWVYRYGIKQNMPVLFTLTIISTISFNTDTMLIFSTTYGYRWFAFFLISLLVFCSLKVDFKNEFASRSYIFWVILYCLIGGLGISFYFKYNNDPYYFNITIYEMTLPFFLWIGYKYGSSIAPKAGVIWGSAMSIYVSFSESLSWGYAGTLIIITGVLIGYFGGIIIKKTKYMNPGAIVLSTYLIVVSISKLLVSIQYDQGRILISNIKIPIIFFSNIVIFLLLTTKINQKAAK